MKTKTSNLFAWDRAKQQEKNLIRWIEALLSGEYKQGRRQLYDPKTDCYCVNGVALREFGFRSYWGWFYFGYEANDLMNLGSRTIAPYKWFDRTFGVPSWPLSFRNDRGQSFAELASILVKFLPDSVKKADLQIKIAEQIKAQYAEQEENRRIAFERASYTDETYPGLA